MGIRVRRKARKGREKEKEKETIHTMWLSLKETLRCTTDPGGVFIPEKKLKHGGRAEPRSTKEGGGGEVAVHQRDVIRGLDACRNRFSELSVGDTSRNIIEMIFQTSSLSLESRRKIERVLKVNNSSDTLEKFEQYREIVKGRAERIQNQKENPRSIADGNELLRFHSTTMACSSSTVKLSDLCGDAQCDVCRTIQSGFMTEEMKKNGIKMSASGVIGNPLFSMKADCDNNLKRAVVVCRVIAGRVLNIADIRSYVVGGDGFDSVVGKGGLCSKWGDLYVCNPNAVLPCFVIVYT